MQVLKWQLNPPTINMWANRVMKQWDDYIATNEEARNHALIRERPLLFKQSNEESFCRYSQIMQLVDCSILDVQTLAYQSKLLALSFMYLVLGIWCVYLGKEFGVFQLRQIISEFPRSSQYMLDESMFNDLFYNFMEFTFKLTPIEILPSVQYCASYFHLPFDFKHPEQIDEREIVTPSLMQLNLEEFESFQMYNSEYPGAVKRRNRGI